MRLPLLDRNDPTALSILFSLFMIRYAARPWDNWHNYHWSQPWTLLLPALALATLLLRPRATPARVGVLLIAILFFPVFLSPATGSSHTLIVHLAHFAASFTRTYPPLMTFYYLALITLLAPLLKSNDPHAPWDLAFARAAIAIVGTYSAAYSLEWIDGIFPPPPRRLIGDLWRILEYITPAILLPAIAWRKPKGLLVWIGATLAGIALTAIIVIETGKLQTKDVAVLSILTAAAPLWAYFDYSATRAAKKGRGFEVITPRPVLPL